MTAADTRSDLPLLFIPRRMAGGAIAFEEIYLGSVLLGSISKNPDGKQMHAWVRLFLPDLLRITWHATSIEAARSVARARIAEWFSRTVFAKDEG